MQRIIFRFLGGIVLLILSVSGCAPSVRQTSDPVFQSYEEGLRELSLAVGEQTAQARKTTLAVLDFTDSENNVTDLGVRLTSDVAEALAANGRDTWVVSGRYLRTLLRKHGLTMREMSEYPQQAATFWQVMGIDVIVSGTAVPDSKNGIRFSMKAIDANPNSTSSGILAEYFTTIALKKSVAPKPLLRAARGGAPSIPEFPWPPPEASASAKIPSEFLRNAEGVTSLQEVANRLETAFEQAGYGEKTYYRLPEGFALVSRLEEFNPDGTSKESPARWPGEFHPPKRFSLTSYVKSLFSSEKGRYRIIAFLVTSQMFSRTAPAVSSEEANAWVTLGALELPEEIGIRAYSDSHHCIALIYEFEQTDPDSDVKFKALSEFRGSEHLEKATIWSALFSLRAILQY